MPQPGCCILALPPTLDRTCWSPEAENMDMTFPLVGPVRKGRRAFQVGWLPKQSPRDDPTRVGMARVSKQAWS